MYAGQENDHKTQQEGDIPGTGKKVPNRDLNIVLPCNQMEQTIQDDCEFGL